LRQQEYKFLGFQNHYLIKYSRPLGYRREGMRHVQFSCKIVWFGKNKNK